jgi:MscS family membrane protein
VTHNLILAALSKSPDGNPPGANVERVDSFTVHGKAESLELSRVKLRSGASVWLFSSGSVDLIPKLARALSDSPIEKYLPAPLVNCKLMDTPLWRWFALLLLTIAVAVVARWLSRVAVACLDPASKRFAPHLNTSLLHLFAGPLALLFGVAGFRALAAGIGSSPQLQTALTRATGLVFFSALAWLGMRIVDGGVVHMRRKLVHHYTFAYSILPLASRVVKILLAAVAVTAILSAWGYNTSAIVAGLGIGGVALALAAQKTVENLFGSVALIADRPVRVGDFCRFGDQSGTVEDIGLRSTRLRTPSRTLLTVPNGLFSTMTVENFSVRDKMWFHLTLNLRRDTSSAQVRALLESIKDILNSTPKVETGIIPVRFVGVGTYSLDLEIFSYVVTRDVDEFLHIQQELFLAILDAVEAAGTALAVPTQAYYAITRGSSPIPATPRETS